MVGLARAGEHARADTHAHARGSHQSPQDPLDSATPRSAGADRSGVVSRRIREVPCERSRTLGARRARQQNQGRGLDPRMAATPWTSLFTDTLADADEDIAGLIERQGRQNAQSINLVASESY